MTLAMMLMAITRAGWLHTGRSMSVRNADQFTGNHPVFRMIFQMMIMKKFYAQREGEEYCQLESRNNVKKSFSVEPFIHS